MKIFICALALVTLALDGYSQEWKPIITYPNKSTTTTTSTTTSSRTNTWNTSNDITVRRKSVCRYGRHPSAGAEERHPVTGNQRYQTHRTIVFNLPFPGAAAFRGTA